MKQYLVTWKIDIDANSPEEAAAAALEIQRREDSTATVFDVREDVPGVGPRHHEIDLAPIQDEPIHLDIDGAVERFEELALEHLEEQHDGPENNEEGK